jgi:molecular chaperone DnaJ
MGSKRGYYEVLGVPRGATQEEIKRSFRRLAFQNHPDRNQEDGAAERFKEINEAYQVLSDPRKRSNYERFEHLGAGESGRGFDSFGDFVGGLGDIFEAFFGSATRTTQRAPQQGADLYSKLTISFEEAVFGCEKEIEVTRIEDCSLCYGLGSKPGSQPMRCPTCNGRGQVRQVHRGIFGHFSNMTTCEYCRGEGIIIAQPCPQCRGRGKERKRHKIAVKVPAGVEDGIQICLSGEGDAGIRGGPPGNLYVNLSVQEHEFFKREGNDILYELPISFAQAALGDKVEVPTVEGKATLNIPAGTQTEEVFRLKGRGVPSLHCSGRGSQLIKVRVITPQNLNPKQRRLFQELAKGLGKVT